MSRLVTRQLDPINRGVANSYALRFTKRVPVSDEHPEGWAWIDKTDKVFTLTAKEEEWDDVEDDSSAVFKVVGTFPDETNEPGRVLFTLSPEDSYLDADKEYYCDITQIDDDYDTSTLQRVFKGRFKVNGGANNLSKEGEDE